VAKAPLGLIGGSSEDGDCRGLPFYLSGASDLALSDLAYPLSQNVGTTDKLPTNRTIREYRIVDSFAKQVSGTFIDISLISADLMKENRLEG